MCFLREVKRPLRARLDSRVLSILAHFCPFFRESTTSELYGVWIQNGPIFGNGRSHTTVRQKNKYLPRYLFYFRTLQRHGTTTQPKNKILLTPANLNHSDTVTTHHPPLSPQPRRGFSSGGVGSTRSLSRCGFRLRCVRKAICTWCAKRILAQQHNTTPHDRAGLISTTT
jgi:hypothetical protein